MKCFEFVVESKYATVGFRQLLIYAGQFLLPRPQFIQRPEQFLILNLELLDRAGDAAEPPPADVRPLRPTARGPNPAGG